MSPLGTEPAPHGPGGDLRGRLVALRDADVLLARHGLIADGVDVVGLVERSEGRLRHGTDHTVVALVGSTGSGKSSMLNALAGEQVSRVGVTRPTTAITQAVTFGAPADGLLDHLGVSLRHQVAGDPGLQGLVLLDLPDFDSVADAHRMEVDRLIQMVDLMAWVTDPQKYADEALHDGYLKPLASHADVMHVLLNKIDTLPDAEAETCVRDLERLLAEDGLPDVRPIATSTTTREGLEAVTGVLAAEVAAREAVVERISADITAAARTLRKAAGAAVSADLASARDAAIRGLSIAAGVDDNAALVGRQYRRDAGLATGWPPLRIIRRLRRAPLEKRITSRASSVATTEVSRSLRATAEELTAHTTTQAGSSADGASTGWRQAAAEAVRGRADAVVEALDTQTTRGIQELRAGPRWWGALGWLHRIWLLLLVVGVGWLLAVAAAETFLLIDASDYVPRWRGIAVPTGLAAIGLGAGLLTAIIGRWLAAVGARRRANRARASLSERVAAVVDAQVLDPVQTLMADAQQVQALLDRAEAR